MKSVEFRAAPSVKKLDINCGCGAQMLFLSKLGEGNFPVNMMCFTCYIGMGYGLYVVEYEEVSGGEIFVVKVFAGNMDDATRIVGELKGLDRIFVGRVEVCD